MDELWGLRISNLRSAVEIAAKDNRGITPSLREDFRPRYEKMYLETKRYIDLVNQCQGTDILLYAPGNEHECKRSFLHLNCLPLTGLYHGRSVERVDDDDDEEDESLGAVVQQEPVALQIKEEERLAVAVVGKVVATDTWPPQSQEEASQRIVEDEVVLWGRVSVLRFKGVFELDLPIFLTS
ncbi:hypothetical protein ACFX2I_015729 [Malus domestica]